MKLLFLGTRGQIGKKTRQHQRHSVLLVREDGTTILIDCGADWLGRVASLRLDAILMTHAHPDHARDFRRARHVRFTRLPRAGAPYNSYPVAGS